MEYWSIGFRSRITPTLQYSTTSIHFFVPALLCNNSLKIE